MTDQVRGLAEAFAQTLSPDRTAIKAAEEHLKVAAKQPGYGYAVLQVITAGADVNPAVKQAAAVNFKNHVKYSWAPSDADAYAGAVKIPDNEKEEIKKHIIVLMLQAPALVRAQLSEALTIISKHDFPHKWENLLPELVQKLDTGDLAVIQGVLETANSIFKRYRNQMGSSELINEYGNCQNVILAPLLELLRKLRAQLEVPGSSADTLKQVLGCLRLIARIFYSLNGMGLTELVEQQLDAWMQELHQLLTYDNPALQEQDPEKESAPDAVRTAVCQVINLFMEINEEEFVKYLQQFVTDVWNLLVKVSLRPGQDNLAMSAIKFLTTVSRSVHHALFSDANVLKQICESIIIPNLQVREEDEEVFDMNPIEYIRRDAEGSDSDTRRRAAADLVKSLTEKYPAEVTALCTGYVQHMLSEYAQSPAANWKAKDCAVYLVVALTVRGRTGERGATTTNQLVNVGDFFLQQVLPELSAQDVNAAPILKADAIKFTTTFRSQLPRDVCLSIFPHLIKLLGSESCVVHSYAASAIERMLALREAGQPRFTPAELAPLLSALLESLFGVFKAPESGENEYAMKAVMRVIMFVGPQMAPAVRPCLSALAGMLVEVCKNPKNPGFNHYLFESVAALIKQSTAADASSVGTFEEMLFPAFELVLQQDVQEFHPYVFQIFAQLIELRPPPLPPVYLGIFRPLLTPVFWERSGNVPALTRLVCAYLDKAAADIVAAGHLQPILGVFQKLVASKAHDHEGLELLATLVESAELSAYQPHLATVWGILFTRLQTSRTPKYVRCLLVAMSRCVIKLGAGVVQQSVDTMQPGLFMMILQQVWVPGMASVEGQAEEKLLAVATCRCLAELPVLQQALPVWDALQQALVAKLQGAGMPAGLAAGAEEGEEMEEMGGYSAAYARLANASRPERTVLPEIADTRQYVEAALAGLAGRM